MAEVNADSKQAREKKVRAKKLSTWIDMTPMVDLAFLLLTFFMLATTFIKPQVMELTMPEKETNDTDQPLVNEKRVLSIVLGENNRIYWYIGITNPKINETDYSSTGIREVLWKNNTTIEKLVVLVKPDNTSTYENLVDILDELEICGIDRYTLVDISKDDFDLIKNHKK